MWPLFSLRPFYAFLASHCAATYAMLIALYFLETPAPQRVRLDAQDLVLLALMPLLSWFMLFEAAAQAHVHGLHAVYAWATYVPTFVLAFTLLWRRRRRPARGYGKCRKCGYDIRATPDRCPECGTETDTGRVPHPRFVR